MSKDHIVKKGETVARIAKKYGYPNWHKIWKHPDNEALRSKRGNPNILYPGDKLTIPEKQSKNISGESEKRNKFRLKSDKLFLRIRMEDAGWEPIINEDFTLDLGTSTVKKKTTGDGLIEEEIPIDLETAHLVIRGHMFVLKIGHLDPVEKISGWTARLKNLGYHQSKVQDEVDEESLAAAEEYQCDAELKVDGDVGQKTQANLEKDHGGN